ncbi:dephospho-CoA kinase [Acinetobacter rongchengensis]|uniref:Dephospho-CoA kinase n=1 Tax=Acinetobacter rongchengensis TaxID=2419601 RepID=A0A3A8ET54_9GAMM|nr:dephospho-CoA kinase [Acinetobacter rongchengensis]RKG38037.1 dephospho-CoA kinase [Acinetobacter rongchengensis]
MTFILGLTGGIGSGKSAASQWFETQGIQVIDADIVAREIVEKGQPALTQIKDTFGDWVLLENGQLNRRALRDHIFKVPDARHQLEQITHPAIRSAIIQQLADATSSYVILVSPLLFETNQHQLTDHTLLIDASEELQILRASQRDGQTIDQIEKIIAAQMPRAEKQKIANDIVLNDGHIEHLYAKLEALHQQYLIRSKQ